jgi:hypothetical protein
MSPCATGRASDAGRYVCFPLASAGIASAGIYVGRFNRILRILRIRRIQIFGGTTEQHLPNGPVVLFNK